MAQQTPPSDRPHAGRVGRVLVALGAALALFVAAGSGAAFAYYLHVQRGIQTVSGESENDKDSQDFVPGSAVGGKCQRSGCNFLLLGSDSRTGLSKSQQEAFGTNKDIGGSQRSDTIMVVHIDPGTEHATILSFPRDLWVDIALPNYGKDKINAAFQGGINGGGPQVVASTIQQISGLHINHWMYVDLAGFEGLVDALGGVRMCVPSPMYDPLTGLHITKPGCQEFDGAEALGYVRTRHWTAAPGGPECDAIGDFARIGRQQQFIRAVMAKVLAPGELLHVTNIVPKLLDNFVVDKDLTVADMLYFLDKLRDLTTGAADFRAVPTKVGWANVSYPPYRLSIVSAVEPQANELFHRILNNQPLGDLGVEQQDTPPSPANISVQVFDHGSDGSASTALKTLQESGFLAPTTVSPYTSLKKPVRGSVLLYRNSAQPMADVVAGYLPGLKLVAVPDSALPDSPVAAVISSGYQPSEPGTSAGGGGGGGGASTGQCPA